MPPLSKERLDKLLVERGLCASRTQAQALIMEGRVTVAGNLVSKPGTLIDTALSEIEIKEGLRYVSRGGLKLEKALNVFHIKVQDRFCIDVGASTGGFTDCLLQNGARHVAAVDVGYGQLDWRLRNDARVQVLEKTHIAHLSAEQLTTVSSLGVVDTSFISLRKVLPPLAALLDSEADIIALLKPQFEARDYAPPKSFKGVVRQPEAHQRILEGVLHALEALLTDWSCIALDVSPITGPKGNIEFLLHYQRGVNTQPALSLEARSQRIREIIATGHAMQKPAQDE